ncbi:hypothetical protein KFE98_07690 [bacterium SCSIO 12741]|nr:hypothetical protein KFE98_07690 [bacterium SCSIO 12741]
MILRTNPSISNFWLIACLGAVIVSCCPRQNGTCPYPEDIDWMAQMSGQLVRFESTDANWVELQFEAGDTFGYSVDSDCANTLVSVSDCGCNCESSTRIGGSVTRSSNNFKGRLYFTSAIVSDLDDEQETVTMTYSVFNQYSTSEKSLFENPSVVRPFLDATVGWDRENVSYKNVVELSHSNPRESDYVVKSFYTQSDGIVGFEMNTGELYLLRK